MWNTDRNVLEKWIVKVILRNVCRKAVDLVENTDGNVLRELVELTMMTVLSELYRKAVNLVWNTDETGLDLVVVMR